MITISHTNGIIAEVDLNKIPKEFVARHSNGVEWIYFETQEEYNIFKEGDFNLDDFKVSVCGLIDERTTNNIFKGFVFDGYIFSMSISAQINLSNIFNIPDGLFPLPYSTKDDKLYSLTLANRQNFYLTALGFKNTVIQAGAALKQQTLVCTTLGQVQDILNTL